MLRTLIEIAKTDINLSILRMLRVVIEYQVSNSIPKYVNEDDAKSGTKPRSQRLEKPVSERGDPHMNEAPVQPLPQGYQWKTVRKHDRHDVIGQ